ncbi:uncharacterized protein LOC118974904 [Sturnira hondurensis]|uniref:uncharacterized protein LOC118974904 n=1 Tax=Sturnira hondurensis TaxID=192404 RepID=UPI00187AE98B|nr:uncharacterized protein LOC118974904 [Sturnira hondurensis]
MSEARLLGRGRGEDGVVDLFPAGGPGPHPFGSCSRVSQGGDPHLLRTRIFPKMRPRGQVTGNGALGAQSQAECWCPGRTPFVGPTGHFSRVARLFLLYQARLCLPQGASPCCEGGLGQPLTAASADCPPWPPVLGPWLPTWPATNQTPGPARPAASPLSETPMPLSSYGDLSWPRCPSLSSCPRSAFLVTPPHCLGTGDPLPALLCGHPRCTHIHGLIGSCLPTAPPSRPGMVTTVSSLMHTWTGPSSSGEEDPTLLLRALPCLSHRPAHAHLPPRLPACLCLRLLPLMVQPQDAALLTSDPVHLGFGSVPSPSRVNGDLSRALPSSTVAAYTPPHCRVHTADSWASGASLTP